MRKLLLGVAASAALFAAGASQAAVTVQIFADEPGAGANATLAQAALLTADETVTVSAIDFTNSFGDSNSSTIGDFLNNPAGLSSAISNHTLNNTYLYITGSVFLHAGDNLFSVSHDDGLQLNIDGVGLVVDQPGPHSPTLTPFNAHATTAGNYNFQLSYGECCGGPAELIVDLNGRSVGGVPEPASWALMILGFGAAGSMLRRRRRAIA